MLLAATVGPELPRGYERYLVALQTDFLGIVCNIRENFVVIQPAMLMMSEHAIVPPRFPYVVQLLRYSDGVSEVRITLKHHLSAISLLILASEKHSIDCHSNYDDQVSDNAGP